MARKTKDTNERKHRRTAKHSACIETMAKANFDAVPSLAEAMGLEEPTEPETGETSTKSAEPS